MFTNQGMSRPLFSEEKCETGDDTITHGTAIHFFVCACVIKESSVEAESSGLSPSRTSSA